MTRRLPLLAALVCVLAAPLAGQNPLTAVFPSAVADDEDLPNPSNFTQTTLTSAINSATTSIPVASVSGMRFPTVVVIDSEAIKVCSNTSLTLNVCSGGRGLLSTATSHSSGANVGVRMTDYHLLSLQAEVVAIETALGASLANVAAASHNHAASNITSGQLALARGGTGADLSATGGSNQFVRQSSAGGALSVSAIADADVPNSITIDLAATATALAANGSNCTNEAAQGVDASGVAEGCLELGEIATSLTNTYVPYVATGFLAGDPDFTFDGDKLTLGAGASKGLWFGDGDTGITEQSDDILDLRTNSGLRVSVSASVFDVQVPIRGPDGTAAAPGIGFRLDTDNGLFRAGANNWGLAVGGASFAELGGSQTLLVQNQTATTGDTTIVFKEGAAEAGNIFEVQDASGSVVFAVDETGISVGGGGGSAINVEEGDSEVIAAASLTGIDFLGADFDVTDDSNEADVAIAAAITRDAEWDTAAEINAATTDDDFATLTGAQTLTNKTLTTPTIASFANATHNHTNAAGGGALDLANFSTTLDTVTLGGGSGFTWTFDASGGTDCTFAPGDNTLTWTCGTYAITGDLAVSGSITAGGSGAALEITEQSAPGAGPSAGVHNVYIDSTNSRFSTHENGGSVLTYLAVQDQNAGTDVTADLEEETHASEHAENAADELLVENLGTACSNGEVPTADGAGGLDCAAAGGGSSYIELFYWLTGIGISGGYSVTNYAPGIWTSTLGFATGTNIQIGAAQFADADGEIAYFRGRRLSAERVTATNLSHVNFEAEVSLQGPSTSSGAFSFFLGVACVSPGELANTAFTSMSFTALSPMTGSATGTPNQLFILSVADQDLTAGGACAVGDVPVYKVEADETSAGMDSTVNLMTFRVWTD